MAGLELLDDVLQVDGQQLYILLVHNLCGLDVLVLDDADFVDVAGLAKMHV